MAITSNFSCVDYLSFKFGCQNLNGDKEIYNHLSQEWFYRPIIKGFSFHAKSDSWSNIFEDSKLSDEDGTVISKKSKHRRHKPARILYKNCLDRSYFASFQIVEDKQKRATEFGGCSGEVRIEEGNFETFLDTDPEVHREVLSIEDIEKDSNSISSNEDDCLSESEQELRQIYRCESKDDFRDSVDAVPLKLSRKRTSNEWLDRTEIENIAKRMRPSINATKMHESRICSCPAEHEESELFLPINL